MKNQLHPGARWIFRLKSYFSIFFLILFFSIWIGSFIFSPFLIDNGFSVLSGIFIIILIVPIIALILGEVYARMAYNRWFYEFTPDNLKIEKGIVWKKYSNIPYSKIQNVDIHRGILARMLGFSSIMIQTAGYSIQRGGMAEGSIPAVGQEDSEKIRDFLMKKLKSSKGQEL